MSKTILSYVDISITDHDRKLSRSRSPINLTISTRSIASSEMSRA